MTAEEAAEETDDADDAAVRALVSLMPPGEAARSGS